MPWYDAFDAIRPPLAHLCCPSCSVDDDDDDDCCGHGCCAWGNRFCGCTMHNAALGYAFDWILIQSHTDPTQIACTDAQFSFDSLVGIPPWWAMKQSFAPLGRRTTSASSSLRAYLEVQNCELRFPITSRGKLRYPTSSSSSNVTIATYQRDNHDPKEEEDEDLVLGSPPDDEEHDPRVLQILAQRCGRERPHRQQSEEGTHARIIVVDTRTASSHRIVGIAPCSIYVWSTADRIVVCDIDGTVTKSNLRGLWDSVVIGRDYRFCHDGICDFLQALVQRQQVTGADSTNNDHTAANHPHRPSSFENIRVLYLTSRPLGLAHSTRRLLQRLQQEPQANLRPSLDTPVASAGMARGPLLGFTGPLRQILVMELLYHNVHEFKAAALQSIVQLWKRVALQPSSAAVSSSSPKNTNSRDQQQQTPFLAGIGNTYMDAQAYHLGGGMELRQIYIINKASEMACLDRRREDPNNSKGGMALDYPTFRRSFFPLGYRDKNLLRHMLESQSPPVEDTIMTGEWSLV